MEEGGYLIRKGGPMEMEPSRDACLILRGPFSPHNGKCTDRQQRERHNESRRRSQAALRRAEPFPGALSAGSVFRLTQPRTGLGPPRAQSRQHLAARPGMSLDAAEALLAPQVPGGGGSLSKCHVRNLTGKQALG